jgi:hypothetical protein
MLAEIFMLRLEAAARVAAQEAPKYSTRNGGGTEDLGLAEHSARRSGKLGSITGESLAACGCHERPERPGVG